jgi:hypothetical protein
MNKRKWFIVLIVMSALALVGSAAGCAPATPPVINSYTASSTSINSGQSTTLNWDVSGADTVTIEPGIGTVKSSGSMVITPEYSTCWELTATNKAASITKKITIIVNTPPSE